MPKKNTRKVGTIIIYIGIWNEDASVKTMYKAVRQSFSEWEGRGVDLQSHKSFTTVCNYVLKEDEEPLIWGTLSLQRIKAMIEKQKKKKTQNPTCTQPEILERLKKMNDIYEIY